MKIAIAGDISLQDRSAKQRWDESQLVRSFAKVKDEVGNCEHAVLNLESPVTDCRDAILKDGPTLKNGLEVFDIIKFCGFDTVTLANNHLRDYGSEGVTDTIEESQRMGIKTVGAGLNVSEARTPLIFEGYDVKIGIINVCENESSIATSTTAGANPLDIANLYYDIDKLHKQVDKVIVIIHGGREHYQLPTPRMKRDYHLIADFGADVIVNHHQHCFSGYEIYKGKPIFYGLGNFFFDNPAKRDNKWNYGLLLKLDIEKSKVDYELLPLEQCNHQAEVKVTRFEKVAKDLEELNAIIADSERLEGEFDKLIENSKPLYPFLPYGNHYLRALYVRGLLPDFISKINKAKIENTVSCETHREILLQYLNKTIHNE